MKRLCGPRTSSHGGKYVYRRKGLLDEIPHVRLIRGVIIVRTEDAGSVVGSLEVFDGEVYTRRVGLMRADRAALAPIRGRRAPAGHHGEVRG